MRKKDKLYTANRFNQPLFQVDREHNNIFDGLTFGQSSLMTPSNNNYGMNYQLTQPQQMSPYNSWMSTQQKLQANYAMQNPGVSQAPISSGGSSSGGGSKAGWATAGKAALGAGMAMAGSIGQSENFKRGLWDRADPLHYLADGKENEVGNAVGDAGVGLFQAGAQSGNWQLMLAGGAAKAVGSLINAGWGVKENKENVNYIKGNTTAARTAGQSLGGASTSGDLLSAAGMMTGGSGFGTGDLYKGGWFSKDKARRKGQKLLDAEKAALAYQAHALATGAGNVDSIQDDNVMSNFAAFGGPLGMAPSMGGAALDYGLAMDYLTQKKREAAYKNKMTGMTQAPAFMPQQGLFALGGDLQSNGADFSTGLTHIDAGGSHEENPNEGVQLGVDQENVPNLVEEGETVFDDYVYSTRILCDDATKQLFHISKKRSISYADLSKKLEKEAEERPNDPISRAGLAAQMHQLAEQQERQKQEMEAQRAKEAFEALSPEEQTAVMQQVAQQEQMAQQQATAEQQATEENMGNQGGISPNPMQADGSEAQLGQEPQMNAMGGRINRFDLGGKAYTRMLNSLGFHTQSEFDKWAEDNSIDFGDLWKNNPNTLNNDILSELWRNEKFKEALRKKNPALAHAFEESGYDFGAYQPTNNGKATIQSISRGNWKATNGQGWFGSEDLAFKQATEGLSDDEVKALSTEQLAQRMSQTDAYRNTSNWLQTPDNALLYLNTLLEDPDTPEVAKQHARKYVQNGQWKDGYTYSYDDVFGRVRATNPGTYWHTAMEANRGNQAQNFVINDDGTVEAIVGAVPTDWTAAGNYAWATPENDIAYNYYRRPAAAAPETIATPDTPATSADNTEETTLAPKHNAEWLRYAGLFGPAVGLGMQMAGIGKPDTASLDAAIEGAGDVRFADYKPLGNYLTYRPLDIWYEQNRLNANARATDRAILNSGANQGSKMAGLLASGYNDQIASGNLFRQAQEYNDNLRKQVAEFNRGTDQFNSEQYGATSRFNAGAWNDANRAARQLRLQAASQKADMDAGWYNGIYGNVAGLFKGLGDLGTENYRMNRIADMAADGIFGQLGDSYTGKKVVKKSKSKGGKVNRKKGLTF